MTRNTGVFLVSVCARQVIDHPVLAGYVFMRRAD